MRAGFARRDITPDKPMQMAGFDRRTAPSTGTLDELYVRVLALNCDQKTFLICSFDLLGTDSTFCETVQAAFAREMDIPSHHVWVCATHTHSGPGCHFDGKNHYSQEYVQFLVDQTLAAGRVALADLQAARLNVSDSTVTAVTSRRNQGRAGAEFPMPLLQIRFVRAADTITLCRICCHPTILDEKNTLYSGDLPSAAMKAAGLSDKCLILNGACADLSTRFTRTASNPQELARIGQILADGMIAAPDSFQDQTPAIQGHARTIYLSRCGSLEGAQREELLNALRAKAAACTDPQAWREYDSRIAVLERSSVAPEKDRRIHIAAVNLGPVVLLSMPFEVDSPDGEDLEKGLTKIANKPVYLCCYTGGYDGYLPSGKPLTADSSYEDIASRYSADARTKVWECATQCILESIQ